MIEPFGKLTDGSIVQAITLGSPDSLQAQVLTYGGILRRLRFGAHSVVVSLPDLDSYIHDRAFVGIVVGRVANRIERARFVLNGCEHRLTANEGEHHLHGGRLGFGKRLWRIVGHDSPNRLRLGLHSPAGEEGYPGNMDVTVEYTVLGNELRVRFDCLADETTPFSPTFHPYFNAGVFSQLLIHADAYLPSLVPTGEIRSVAGTPFDFRVMRPLRLEQGYDHCWVLNSQRPFDAKLRLSSGIR